MSRQNPDDDGAALVDPAITVRFRPYCLRGEAKTEAGVATTPIRIDDMRQEARDTLKAIKTLSRLEAWIRCAKAELASSPQDELLAEFIRVNERLLAVERQKLLAA